MIINTTSPLSLGVAKPAAGSQPVGTAFTSVFAEFEKEMKESPYERMMDAVLKSHGLTKEQFSHLGGPQQDAISKEVAHELKKSLETQKGQPTASSLYFP